MDAQEAIDAVIAWVQEKVPAIEGTYDFDTGSKVQPLPDVMVECVIEGIDRSNQFPVLAAVQQISGIYAYGLEMSLMAEISDPDDPAAQQQSAHDLRNWMTTLRGAIRQDGTLSGRVQMVSPFYVIRYRPGHVEFEDGTRGREARMELTVGEIQEVV
jgi:hypothetical protein